MYKLNYYPWLTQNVPIGKIDGQIKIFSKAVAEEARKLGMKNCEIEVLRPLDVPAQIKQIVDRKAQIALMNPLGFEFARQRSADVQAVAVAERIIDGKIGIVYFAQLYTHKKTGIRSPEVVTGRSIGYGLPYSTSNFLIPAARLYRAGVHPLLGFSRVEFLKGHEIIAKNVYEGKIEVGAGHDGVIVDLSNQQGYKDAEEQLVQIDRSEAIPSDPVVVNIPDDKERALIQEALVASSKREDVKTALKIFWGNAQGLAATRSDQYDIIGEALTALRLTDRDLLP